MDALRALRALEEMEREDQGYSAEDNRADDGAVDIDQAEAEAEANELHMLENEIRSARETDPRSLMRPVSGLSKVLDALDENTTFSHQPSCAMAAMPLNRANTFPAKLLSRRIESARHANKEVRRSETLSRVYLRQSLFGMRGEETYPVSPTESDMYESRSDAPLPDYLANADLVEEQSTLFHGRGNHFADSSLPFSTDWGYGEDLDAYYIGSGEEFEFGYFESDEEVDYRMSSNRNVPHIRVTAH